MLTNTAQEGIQLTGFGLAVVLVIVLAVVARFSGAWAGNSGMPATPTATTATIAQQ